MGISSLERVGKDGYVTTICAFKLAWKLLYTVLS